MWKVEFRPMIPEERAELERVDGEVAPSAGEGSLSWVNRLFGTARSSVPELKESLRRDLKNGRIQVIHVTTGEAVRLIHSDGSLAGFFVDVGSGLVMFVEAREWESPGMASDFERLFPCTRFSLIRAPHSGVDLDFVCEGSRYEATRDIEAPSREILEAVARDGEFLPARLDSLEEDLERLFLHSWPGMAPQGAA